MGDDNNANPMPDIQPGDRLLDVPLEFTQRTYNELLARFMYVESMCTELKRPRISSEPNSRKRNKESSPSKLPSSTRVKRSRNSKLIPLHLLPPLLRPKTNLRYQTPPCSTVNDERYSPSWPNVVSSLLVNLRLSPPKLPKSSTPALASKVPPFHGFPL